ncbi:MAG TPA: hypothetical protein VEA16_14880 [Vicinamibacterales bacterium]|nr:hypothetical protein [Vicinamibacterales bacterium]
MLTLLRVVATSILSVTVSVDPHPDNLEVLVVLESSDPKRGDEWKAQSLPPEGGTFTATWEDLPPGRYTITVALARWIDGKPVEVDWVLGGTHEVRAALRESMLDISGNVMYDP